ncbi:hypothetical protein BDZ45DRAFT_677939 [Acephala macrosclerotiorum]|nr:hypothetical protein BDZ45DRAFT_677939 [Acephala macrosclerotiorum]
MPLPPSVSGQSPLEPATTIFEPKDTDSELLDVGFNTNLDEKEKEKEKEREFSKEIGENFIAHDPPASLSSKHEINGGTPPIEPGSEFIIWRDEPEYRDPENPVHWFSTKKWVNICTISVISFLVPLVSSMLAPGVELVMEDFNTKSTTFATRTAVDCGVVCITPS